jgi:hypothetical protein
LVFLPSTNQGSAQTEPVAKVFCSRFLGGEHICRSLYEASSDLIRLQHTSNTRSRLKKFDLHRWSQFEQTMCCGKPRNSTPNNRNSHGRLTYFLKD